MVPAEKFSILLGLVQPCLVGHVTFKVEDKRLNQRIHSPKSIRSAYNVCSVERSLYHTYEHTLPHMGFFQHDVYLHGRAPWVKCSESWVHQLRLPWTREMPVLMVARPVGETNTVLWRMFEHYVPEARTRADMANTVGVDETSSFCHLCITIFIGQGFCGLLFATSGNDVANFERFTTDLEAHGGSADGVTYGSMDLLPAFQKGATEHLSSAQAIFGYFCPVKLANQVVDHVLGREAFTKPVIKKTLWLLLEKEPKLRVKQKEKLPELIKDQNIITARDYNLRWILQYIFIIKNCHRVAILFKASIENINNNGLSPMVMIVYTFMNYWDDVLFWFESVKPNSMLEGLNIFNQTVKARDYLTTHNHFINMAYLIMGKLNLRLST